MLNRQRMPRGDEDMDSGAEAYRRFLMGDDYVLEQVINIYKDVLI